MRKNKYFIKKDYIENKINITLDKNRERKYWDRSRVKKSLFYQYGTYSFARNIMKKNNLQSVLDLGCGTGLKLAKILAPYANKVVGVDQEDPIKYCKQHYKKGKFVVDNFDSPNKKFNEKFDLILAADVIEHLQKPENLLKYIRLHSHKDTLVIISTPERDLLRGVDCFSSPKPEHLREWNKKEFLKFLKSEKFKIIETHILAHMKFNLSLEYFIKLLSPKYKIKHTMVILAKAK